MRRTLAVLLALLATSCALPGGSGSGELDGQVFVSTDVLGHPTGRRDRVRVTFADGRMTFTNGCHESFGPYSVDDDRLDYEQSPDNFQEASYCIGPGRSSELEAWVEGFMVDQPEVVVADGVLILTRGDDSIRFRTRQ